MSRWVTQKKCVAKAKKSWIVHRLKRAQQGGYSPFHNRYNPCGQIRLSSHVWPFQMLAYIHSRRCTRYNRRNVLQKEKMFFNCTYKRRCFRFICGNCIRIFCIWHFSARLTFVICIIVTAVAILLSMQTKNQIVCTFASLGGYLPVVVLYLISFGKAASDNMFLPVSSAYFCLLAIVVFIMTYNKNGMRRSLYRLHCTSRQSAVSALALGRSKTSAAIPMLFLFPLSFQ